MLAQEARLKGFTLIEMTVTISIFVILTGIAVPSFQTTMKNNRVKTQSNALLNSFVTARTAAISNNHPVIVCTSANGIECSSSPSWEFGWIIIADINADGNQDAGEAVLQANQALTGQTSLRTNGSVKSKIYYLHDGTLATREQFNLCAGDDLSDGVSIAVSVTGRPSLESGALACP